MKKASTQQEILLVTGTDFSSRVYSPKDDKTGEPSSLSETEQLEQACWNGLLPDMLPEIYQQDDKGNSLYLWDIKEAGSFLALDLAQFPTPKEKYFSIDPYVFLSEQVLS
jgi:hypothetical protein